MEQINYNGVIKTGDAKIGWVFEKFLSSRHRKYHEILKLMLRNPNVSRMHYVIRVNRNCTEAKVSR